MSKQPEFFASVPAQTRHDGTKSPAAKGLTLILALAFLTLGSLQVWNPKQDVFNLARLGFPEWLVSMIGFAEIGGGLLLIIPSTAAVGANGLGMIMAGAVLAHLNRDENRAAILPLVLLTFLNIIAYLRTFGAWWPASTDEIPRHAKNREG